MNPSRGKRPYSPLIETLNREELEPLQWKKLRRLLERVAAMNPFYQDRFEAAGLKLDRIVDLEAFQRLIPLTRKDDLLADQERFPPYGSRLGVPPGELRMVGTTGGTSGRGREVHAYSEFDLAAYAANLSPGCYWAGLRPGDPILNTFPISLSTAGQLLHSTFTRQRLFQLPVGVYETVEKLEHAVSFGAKAVVGTPSYLRTLAHVARSEGIDLPDSLVSVLLTATEAFSVEWAERLERDWGAKLFEWYGTSQRICAWTCELGAVHEHGRGVLHWLPHVVHVEVIDRDSGEHVAPGHHGELVGTFLDSEASPVMRFATGDRARFLGWNSCECGRALPGIESGTVSRYDDMFKVKGVSVWPADVDAVVLVEEGIEDYRGRVLMDEEEREQIEVVVRFADHASSDARAVRLREIRRKLRAALGLRFEVREAEGDMATFKDERSKARRWTDDRGLT